MLTTILTIKPTPGIALARSWHILLIPKLIASVINSARKRITTNNNEAPDLMASIIPITMATLATIFPILPSFLALFSVSLIVFFNNFFGFYYLILPYYVRCFLVYLILFYKCLQLILKYFLQY